MVDKAHQKRSHLRQISGRERVDREIERERVRESEWGGVGGNDRETGRSLRGTLKPRGEKHSLFKLKNNICCSRISPTLRISRSSTVIASLPLAALKIATSTIV